MGGGGGDPYHGGGGGGGNTGHGTIYIPGTQMGPLVLIGSWTFFWRVEAQKQGTNRFQVYIYIFILSSCKMIICCFNANPLGMVLGFQTSPKNYRLLVPL